MVYCATLVSIYCLQRHQFLSLLRQIVSDGCHDQYFWCGFLSTIRVWVTVPSTRLCSIYFSLWRIGCFAFCGARHNCQLDRLFDCVAANFLRSLQSIPFPMKVHFELYKNSLALVSTTVQPLEHTDRIVKQLQARSRSTHHTDGSAKRRVEKGALRLRHRPITVLPDCSRQLPLPFKTIDYVLSTSVPTTEAKDV